MIETCHVANDDCDAPAGFGIPGVGVSVGRRAARFRCGDCDQPVCGKCSTGRGRARRCYYCEAAE